MTRKEFEEKKDRIQCIYYKIMFLQKDVDFLKFDLVRLKDLQLTSAEEITKYFNIIKDKINAIKGQIAELQFERRILLFELNNNDIVDG
jgi:hypothetical protein